MFACRSGGDSIAAETVLGEAKKTDVCIDGLLVVDAHEFDCCSKVNRLVPAAGRAQ